MWRQEKQSDPWWEVEPDHSQKLSGRKDVGWTAAESGKGQRSRSEGKNPHEKAKGVKCRHQHCTWAELPAKEQRPPTWVVKGLYVFYSFIL